MAFFDMPLEQLQSYQPPRSEPQDFDAFWQASLAEARIHPLNARFTPYEAGMRMIEAYDVSFAGFGGQTIKGWYLRPAGIADALPCVVEFIGYGGGRGFPHDWLFWPAAGFASFVMDTRGQGSAWRHGDTPDLPNGANPAIPGYMTQGILDPQHYYYRRVFTDAVRAVEAARTRSDVNFSKIILSGGSQGGGIALAAAALCDDIVLALPDVPFLCHFRRAVGLTDRYPYKEIADYLNTHRDKEERVFGALDYFDGLNFAPRINAECFFSAALMDLTCPPSTIYAVYNHITAPKEIRSYRFNDHEGGGMHHLLEKLQKAAPLLA